MADITCGNCGGTHPSVAEVRGCFAAGPGVAAKANSADWPDESVFASDEAWPGDASGPAMPLSDLWMYPAEQRPSGAGRGDSRPTNRPSAPPRDATAAGTRGRTTPDPGRTPARPAAGTAGDASAKRREAWSAAGPARSGGQTRTGSGSRGAGQLPGFGAPDRPARPAARAVRGGGQLPGLEKVDADRLLPGRAVRRAASAGRTATELAGPDVLGRWLVVPNGGEIPEPWSSVERFVLDAAAVADPEGTLEILLPRWLGRDRMVIELSVEFSNPPAPVEQSTPWQLDPTFTFTDEQLWFVVWSNSIDATGHAPRWPVADAAAELGGPAEGTPGANGPLFYDGGPIGVAPEGLTVIHRVAVERRLLAPLGNDACTAELAADQLAAVTHPGGAARIIAPAGSGKTRVLTERARHLLQSWNLPSSALTLVAFNTRAADEIRSRTTDLDNLQIRTLNALALAIVNGSGPFRNRGARLATIDEREVRNILQNLVTFPRKANTDPAQAWIDALALVRLGLRSPTEVEAIFGGEVPGFAEVFPRYREALADRGAIDFDEQITAAIVALLTEPATRARAQQVARVLLVDEFQDLAPAHVLLLRLLAGPEMAVFGVGDDDQTIYGFAGATPEWLIEFDRLFPGAGKHPLEVNYRCPPSVVAAAATLLTHNRRRVAKEIRPRVGRVERSDDLTVIAADDLVDATVQAVRRRLTAGATGPGAATSPLPLGQNTMAAATSAPAESDRVTTPSDIAVLTRVTASLAPVQVALRHAGIPVANAVDARYLDRTGVRTALAWLDIASSPDRLRARDIESTARRPTRGLSPKVVEWMAGCQNRQALTKLAGRLNSERDSDKVSAYVDDLSRLAAKASAGADTAGLLRYVRANVGLDDAISKLDRSRGDAQSTHLDDLDALTALAALHPDHTTFAQWLSTELSAPGDPNGVVLSSIHRVKGREWPHIVLYDVRDGVMPHRLSDDLGEERRVFHVGLTRCSESVTVIADITRSSPYLAEMVDPALTVASAWTRTVTSGGPPNRRPNTDTPTRERVEKAPVAAEFTGNEDLRTALRLWRTERAKADGVPAYVVFTNVTLDALAELAPTTLDMLRRIPGIGPAKRDRYGEIIVDLIRSYVPGAEG